MENHTSKGSDLLKLLPFNYTKGESKMNYLKQVNKFYELLLINPLNANSQCLYFALLNINNKCNWIKNFTVANTTLMMFTGLNISALQRARNNLIQKGYVKYQKGKSNNAGFYEILEFEQQSEQQDEQQDEQQTDNTANTLNKLNKTKQKIKENKKEKNEKKKYGEFGNVLLSDDEHIKLQNMFPKDYESRIQSLDDYIQSKGKKYKDFVSTLRAWARKEGYVFPTEQKQYKEVTITEDEYYKNGGNKKYV